MIGDPQGCKGFGVPIIFMPCYDTTRHKEAIHLWRGSIMGIAASGEVSLLFDCMRFYFPFSFKVMSLMKSDGRLGLTTNSRRARVSTNPTKVGSVDLYVLNHSHSIYDNANLHDPSSLF